ncbi:hypothetical protein ABPG77_004915 [Micractinium sp. CCAP 211/92]
MSAGREEDNNNSYVVLQHPSGSKVYVVGTAHVSRKAVEDVVSLIQRVSPATVVLELDADREKKLLEQAEQGDTYGVKKLQGKSTWQIVKMSLSGEALPFFMSTAYTITGALMGTAPGGEFIAADEAARAIGAQIVLADREQDATMARLQYYTRYLTRQDSRRQAETRRMHEMMDRTSPSGGQGGFPTDTTRSGGMPGFLRRDQGPTLREREVEEEVRESQAANPEDPWGLGPAPASEAGMQQRLEEMMREGGCARPNAVLEAARRLFRDGMDPKGRINPEDILAVRECGNSLVETFRQRAIKGDDTWLQRLEREQVAGAKEAAGMERSNAAIQKVVVDERDLILARRLWEAGQETAGQPVVGVVGAGHIKGITRYWDEAGEPATEAKVQRFLQAPAEDGSPWLTAALTGVVLGTIAYRRPRAAGFFVGAVALATAPFLGFTAATVNRFSKFATKLVDTVDSMDGGAPPFGDQGGGWGPGGGTDEWK